MKYSTESLEG